MNRSTAGFPWQGDGGPWRRVSALVGARTLVIAITCCVGLVFGHVLAEELLGQRVLAYSLEHRVSLAVAANALGVDLLAPGVLESLSGDLGYPRRIASWLQAFNDAALQHAECWQGFALLSGSAVEVLGFDEARVLGLFRLRMSNDASFLPECMPAVPHDAWRISFNLHVWTVGDSFPVAFLFEHRGNIWPVFEGRLDDPVEDRRLGYASSSAIESLLRESLTELVEDFAIRYLHLARFRRGTTDSGPESLSLADDEAILIEGYLPKQRVDLRRTPLVFIEDVGRPAGPVRFVERERQRWLAFTLLEISPAEEDPDWFGWIGGDSMIVLDPQGIAVKRMAAPYNYRLRDVTGDGADELVLYSGASGVSGCCDGISVFAQQESALHELFSVRAFGSVRLADLDGDGVYEVVGDSRLWSSMLPSVGQVQVPFACAWDGTRLSDVSTSLGKSHVDDWMAQRRDELTLTRDDSRRVQSAAGRQLVAAALLFGMPAALDELQWIEGNVGPELAREVMLDLDDFMENLVLRNPCR